MTAIASLVVVALLAGETWLMQSDAVVRSSEPTGRAAPTLEDAQRSFYSGRYEDAAALSVNLCAAGADDDRSGRSEGTQDRGAGEKLILTDLAAVAVLAE